MSGISVWRRAPIRNTIASRWSEILMQVEIICLDQRLQFCIAVAISPDVVSWRGERSEPVGLRSHEH
jgi:hypothetical protein